MALVDAHESRRTRSHTLDTVVARRLNRFGDSPSSQIRKYPIFIFLVDHDVVTRTASFDGDQTKKTAEPLR